jgi:hypothetical protein
LSEEDGCLAWWAAHPHSGTELSHDEPDSPPATIKPTSHHNKCRKIRQAGMGGAARWGTAGCAGRLRRSETIATWRRVPHVYGTALWELLGATGKKESRVNLGLSALRIRGRHSDLPATHQRHDEAVASAVPKRGRSEGEAGGETGAKRGRSGGRSGREAGANPPPQDTAHPYERNIATAKWGAMAGRGGAERQWARRRWTRPARRHRRAGRDIGRGPGAAEG